MDNDILNQLQNLIDEDDDLDNIGIDFERSFSMFEEIGKLRHISFFDTIHIGSGEDSHVGIGWHDGVFEIETSENIGLGTTSPNTQLIVSDVMMDCNTILHRGDIVSINNDGRIEHVENNNEIHSTEWTQQRMIMPIHEANYTIDKMRLSEAIPAMQRQVAESLRLEEERMFNG